MSEISLTMLSQMTGETDEDTLSFYVENAKDVVLNKVYPYQSEGTVYTVPDRYNGVVVRIAAYFLNKRGAEGQLQHNENNIFRYYEAADVPPSLLTEIVPFAGVPR